MHWLVGMWIKPCDMEKIDEGIVEPAKAIESGSRSAFLASQKALRQVETAFQAWKWSADTRKNFDRLLRRWSRGSPRRKTCKCLRAFPMCPVLV